MAKKIVYFIVGLILGAALHQNYKGFIDLPQRIVKAFKPAFPLVWDMIDVSQGDLQGDAHLIRTHKGKVVLIDAGYAAPAAQRLLPFIQQENIDHIDFVVITHPHKDHYQGVRVLMQAGIEIGAVYFNLPEQAPCDQEIPWGCDYQDVLNLRSELLANHIPLKDLNAGEDFDLGSGAHLTILYAFHGPASPSHDINDLSAIMRLEYRNQSVLFTGDLNEGLGSYLAQRGENLAADVLKVPHHGLAALAPTTFFEKVNPKWGMVPGPSTLWCTGRSAQVRDWAEKQGVRLFINGFHGHVKLDFTGQEYQFTTEKSPGETLCTGYTP